MKNKWKLIVIFFLSFICLSMFGMVAKVPVYKPIQLSSIKIENTYKYFVVFNDVKMSKVNKLKLNQDDNEFIIEKSQIKFKEDRIAEIKNMDKKFDPIGETKVVAILNSERIMYYLINKTFSRK